MTDSSNFFLAEGKKSATIVRIADQKTPVYQVRADRSTASQQMLMVMVMGKLWPIMTAPRKHELAECSFTGQRLYRKLLFLFPPPTPRTSATIVLYSRNMRGLRRTIPYNTVSYQIVLYKSLSHLDRRCTHPPESE
jgi:hypothetical protein